MPSGRRLVPPIVNGLAILAAGLVPWHLLSQLNARVRPDLPWAALVSIAYLTIGFVWLAGLGPPRGSAASRRELMRLWPPRAVEGDGVPIGSIAALFLLYVAWTAMGRLAPPPDLSAYPTTAYRWSMFLMGGITAGIVEEVAFRGYMQSGIERFDRQNAVWITSVVFVFAHATQGLGAMLALAPGLFIASMLYGMLAQQTGTILPGIVIHVLGDLARVYFGVLRGDGSVLFVE